MRYYANHLSHQTQLKYVLRLLVIFRSVNACSYEHFVCKAFPSQVAPSTQKNLKKYSFKKIIAMF